MNVEIRNQINEIERKSFFIFFFMSNDVDENFASLNNDTKLFELCENIQVIQFYP